LELDVNIGTVEDAAVGKPQSSPDESLGTFLTRNQQLLLDEVHMEKSLAVDGVADQVPPSDNLTDFDSPQNSATDAGLESVDESGQKVPSIEDFCSKDTKTLNTNVLMAETAVELATDSEKFHKAENTAELAATSAAESLDEEVTAEDQLHELLLAACDGSVGKPVKETNLVANCREKFVDAKIAPNAVAAFSLASPADIGCFVSAMEQCCRKPAGVDGPAAELDAPRVRSHDNVNNIKRIKIDDQAEKNLRMQAKLKVNTEQNATRPSAVLVADCTAANPDQLIQNLPTSAAISADRSQSVQASAASRAGDMRRAEEAWRAYTSRNRSVIVDTFQGQFKSTVSCALFTFNNYNISNNNLLSSCHRNRRYLELLGYRACPGRADVADGPH